METRWTNRPHDVLASNSGSRKTIYTFREDSLIISQNNPFVNGRFIRGGPFYAYSRETDFAKTGGSSIFQGKVVPYELRMGLAFADRIAPLDGATHKRDANTAQTSLFGQGATAWKRMRPGNPQAGLATFLGELKDGLPSIPLKLFNRLRNFRSLGDEYLNGVFGWLPFVEDVKKMYQLHLTLDKHLAQIIRDNGKGIHRRRTLSDDSTTTESTTTAINTFGHWGGVYPSIPAGSMIGNSVSRLSTTVSKNTWAVGKYRYYIPDIGSSQWTKRATRALYGANVTPEVLWNLVPWSWAIDWFSNMGDVMSNMSSNAVDNLVADYAFVMETTRTVKSQTITTTWSDVGSPGGFYYFPKGSASQSCHYETIVTKNRVAASPYGFGVQFDSLSNYQLGVVAALGISRWG